MRTHKLTALLVLGLLGCGTTNVDLKNTRSQSHNQNHDQGANLVPIIGGLGSSLGTCFQLSPAYNGPEGALTVYQRSQNIVRCAAGSDNNSIWAKIATINSRCQSTTTCTLPGGNTLVISALSYAQMEQCVQAGFQAEFQGDPQAIAEAERLLEGCFPGPAANRGRVLAE